MRANTLRISDPETTPARPAPSLTLRLLGPFEALVEGRPLPRTRAAKDRWLLALLAMQGGRTVTRAWLAEMLWPQGDYSEGQSRGYLRRSLSELRKALGPCAGRLESPDQQDVRLNIEGADIDVVRFDAALTQGDPQSLHAAVEFYRGPLLLECTEGWVAQERERRAGQYRDALVRLSEAAAGDGRNDEAIGLLRRAVKVDPLNESFVCRLMRLLASTGDFNGAVTAYSELRNALQRSDLNLPNAETMALYQEIRQQSREKATAVQAPSSPAAAPPAPRSGAPAPPIRRGSLPAFLTAVVGREREMARIETQFETRRLITLVGPGGVGKTRLAVYAAERMGSLCADGCVFVDLVAVQHESRVAWAIATAAGLEPQGSITIEQVADLLHHREILLILDNCEHLQAACVAAAQTLVERCPLLHLIATSRRQLDLVGELVLQVRPLSLASADSLGRLDEDLVSLVAGSPAVQLFLERAADAVSEIVLTPQNVRMIDGLCRRLDGIPLALELAAARLRTSTLAELHAQIENHLTALNDRRRTSRHQRLQAVVDWSYRLLSPDERALLASLSVFRGGATREAVKGVCEEWISPGVYADSLLESMVDHSLVVTDDDETGRRFRLLEVIRQYARERLQTEFDADEQNDLKSRHAGWYSRLAKRTERDLYDHRQVEAIRRLNREQENLTAALEQYLETQDGKAAVSLCSTLAQYWAIHGLHPHIEKMVEAALRLAGPSPKPDRDLARMMAFAAFYADCARKTEEAQRLSAASLELARSCADPEVLHKAMLYRAWSIRHVDPAGAERILESAAAQNAAGGTAWLGAEILSTLGFILLYQDRKDAAERHFQSGLELAQSTGDRWIRAELLYHLGILYAERSELSRAFGLFEQALDAQMALGDRPGTAITLLYLAEIALREEEIARAATYFRQSLATSRELGRVRAMCAAIEGLGCVAAAAGNPARAARLLGASDAMNREPGHAILPALGRSHDRYRTACKDALGQNGYSAEHEIGRQWRVSEAIQFALREPELLVEIAPAAELQQHRHEAPMSSETNPGDHYVRRTDYPQ